MGPISGSIWVSSAAGYKHSYSAVLKVFYLHELAHILVYIDSINWAHLLIIDPRTEQKLKEFKVSIAPAQLTPQQEIELLISEGHYHQALNKVSLQNAS